MYIDPFYKADALGFFAPNLEREVVRPTTPLKSSAPRTSV